MIRVPFLVPRLGVRYAELIEMPVILVVIFLAARWIARSWIREFSKTEALFVGFASLAMMLTSEIGLGMALSGRGPVEVLLGKDPVSGSVYYLSLLVFAVLPWVFAIRYRA
jgi:hypothetical protein